MGFSDVIPRIYSIGKIPLNAPLRQQLALWKFRRLRLKRYDFFIIAGDWAMSAAVNNKPNLWYVHSPIREIWDSYRYVRNDIVPFPLRNFFDIWVYYNRYLNKKYIRHVGKIACNSKNTKNRVKNFLGRTASVINPPIETSKFKFRKGTYWLSVNRLLAAKRVDMQIKAFSKLPKEKLVIVGSYEKSKHFLQYTDYLKKIKPGNVKILSWVNDEELVELYANCTGFIATAMDEDFGMTVVEAMASGKPVIACNEGGYRETIIDGKTGFLIDDINSDKLVKFIKTTSKELDKNPYKYREACIKQAKKFDVRVFMKKIKEEIKKD